MEYSDDYATCECTYATLRIYPGHATPEFVTSLLGVAPSKSHRASDGASSSRPGKKINAWLLSTQDIIDSRDSRRHIDWLISKLEGKQRLVQQLQESGAKIDISCFWLSASGHGGPVLSPPQMHSLSILNIEVWWDVYFNEAEITGK